MNRNIVPKTQAPPAKPIQIPPINPTQTPLAKPVPKPPVSSKLSQEVKVDSIRIEQLSKAGVQGKVGYHVNQQITPNTSVKAGIEREGQLLTGQSTDRVFAGIEHQTHNTSASASIFKGNRGGGFGAGFSYSIKF